MTFPRTLLDGLWRWWHGVDDEETQGQTTPRLACGCPAPDVWLVCPHCAERRCHFHRDHDCHGGLVELRDPVEAQYAEVGDTFNFGARPVPVVDSGHAMCDGPCCREERLTKLVEAFPWDRYKTWLQP